MLLCPTVFWVHTSANEGEALRLASIKIGINMAGAVSAGAYTAGVLDFLTEALDDWEAAKREGQTVPVHEVSIEVISGASAGGMCAAIAAVLLQGDFEHIHDTGRRGTTNTLYESWVNEIDIKEFLRCDDLQQSSVLRSLLDSSVIDEIAASVLKPRTKVPQRRPYVSPDLTLYLSLTNLRGTPYSLNGRAPGSVEETTFFFGDRIKFQICPGCTVTQSTASTHLLDFADANGPEWQTLRIAAAATGAFPIFLAPKILLRNAAEYTPPLWESGTAAATGAPPPIRPNFPRPTPNPLQTLNVDGGITNNDPFIYAHDHLAKLEPRASCSTLTVPASEVDRTVINVAPFPTMAAFETNYDPVKAGSVFSMFGSLINVLLSQSRFFGESLSHVMNGTTFDRFVIAPSDAGLGKQYRDKPEQTRPPALQCATLGAFGGFFYRGFRAHDFELGRRNCQKFLRDRFLLPEDNVIMQDGLRKAGAKADATLRAFGCAAPRPYNESEDEEEPTGLEQDRVATDGKVWIPIIPLCGSAAEPISPVQRVQMPAELLDEIVDLILGRLKAVVSVMLSKVRSPPLRIFLRAGQPAIRFLARAPLKQTLARKLGESVR